MESFISAAGAQRCLTHRKRQTVALTATARTTKMGCLFLWSRTTLTALIVSKNNNNRKDSEMLRSRKFIVTTQHGASVVVKAPDGDVARFRAERAGFRVASVRAA